MTVLFVSGTDTGVGKTVTTAALACHARLAGLDVAVCKPAQTGTGTGPGAGDDDLAEIGRLSGVEALTAGWRYPEPLAPVAAARRAGLPLPTRTDLVDLIESAHRRGGLTLVEGAGGLLVTLGRDGVTLGDLAVALSAPVLLVVRSGLGTLNHTALNLEALAARNVSCAGLVIGGWPTAPGVADVDNRAELARLAPVRAALPWGAGASTPAAFETLSVEAFDGAWVRTL